MGWTLVGLGSVVIILIAAAAIIVAPTCRRAESGIEYAPRQIAPKMLAHFRETIGWTNISETDIERVWVHGLRDTLVLCRMHLRSDQFASLRRCIVASTNASIRADDSDSRRLCPFGLAGEEADPTIARRVPGWWAVPSLQDFDGLLFESSAGDWSWWFAYQPSSNQLYMLGIDM